MDINNPLNKQNFESHQLPNGELVTFYPETHQYFVRGVELPSITTLVNKIEGKDTYSHVNPALLKASADYGTTIHDELNQFLEAQRDDPDCPIISGYPEVNNFFNFIQPMYDIKLVLSEKVVVLYDDENKPYAAGRFDLLYIDKDNNLTLSDFKTTSAIHRSMVTSQLNMYLIAARQSGYIAEDAEVKLTVIHLHRDISKIMPIFKLGDGFRLKIFA